MAQMTISHLYPLSFISDSNLSLTLGEEFCLCDNKNMVFHWADFSETCDIIRNQVLADKELREDYRKRESGIDKLKLIPVWVRTSSKIHQTTMFNLYESYILNQAHLVGVDLFGPIDISFISATGPFKSMAIAECFNRGTYKDFVMLYLIKGKLPKRDYRIRLKSKILLEYGRTYQKAQLIDFEQITSHGLLFSIESSLFMKEISNENQMRLLIDTKILRDISSKTLLEIQTLLDPYTFNLMYSSNKQDGLFCTLSDFTIKSSFDFLVNKKVYMFVSYNKLIPENPENLENIEDFITYSRDLVLDYYRKNLSIKSA